MSGYRSALDHTCRTLELRARYFRNQVVAVALIGLASLTLSIWERSRSPLLGLSLWLPICGFCLIADVRLLSRWRAALFALWVNREIDLNPFRMAVNANPALPKGTIDAMLVTLPTSGALVEEHAISGITRRAIAAAYMTTDKCASRLLATYNVGYAVALGCIGAATYISTWKPLVAIGLFCVFPPIKVLLRRLRDRQVSATQSVCRSHPEFSETAYRRIVSMID
jgi:hypothetical protein